MDRLLCLRALAVPLAAVTLLLGPAVALSQGTGGAPSWSAIDSLLNDQRVEAAAKATEARLAQARARRDEDEVARALVRTVRLRIQLQGHETAVRFLREQPWPQGVLPRTVLQLYYAHALVNYATEYGYEVHQRERVASAQGVDLKAWTYEQLLDEARRAHEEVWKVREQLGTRNVGVLSEYIRPNTYPEDVRGTLRDAVSYLYVGLLADSAHWRPDHANDVYRLDLGALLEGAPQVELGNPDVHPLVKTVALLADLEAWHRAGGRRAAALEARLTRYQHLSEHFTEKEDRERIRAHLATTLEGARDVPWWAMGQGLLAELEAAADHRVRAHRLAQECLQAYPGSVGAGRCSAVVAKVMEPGFTLSAMRSDGVGERSLAVVHRNLPALHFRAWRVDMEAWLANPKPMNVLPRGPQLRELIENQAPVATWRAELPATPDFRDHRTYVVPPLKEPGVYILAASAREGFEEQDNQVLAVVTAVTPWVLVARYDWGRRVEARLVEGKTGRPVPGVELRLFATDYKAGHRELRGLRTDARGEVVFDAGPELAQRESVFLVAGRGAEALPSQETFSFFHRGEQEPRLRSLVFTDRSIYRPLQKIQWKVVAFQGSREQARFRVSPETELVVSLRDANAQNIERRTVKTNVFGSVAGEFTIPPGRALGGWSVVVESGGEASVRVEEYKRPTFEVKLLAARDELRLNRPATFRGEARYYFGLPVTAGTVRWRVHREPRFPWWGWHGGARGRPGQEVVATGTSSLAEDGGFQLTFTPEADERAARDPNVTWSYRVEADVTDEGGETRSAERSFRLGLIALEGSVGIGAAFFRAGTPSEISLTRTNLDGVPRPGQGTWRLVELQQPARPVLPSERPVEEPLASAASGDEGTGFTTPGDRLSPRWAPQEGYYLTVLRRWKDGAELARGTVEHDAQGQARARLPVLKPGAYRVHYETVDAFGQKATAKRDFLVAGERMPVALPAMLQAERTSARVGETVRLLAFSGFEDMPLFLDLYQSDRRILRRVLTGRDSALIELPVTESLRGGFTAVLVGVRDYQLLQTVQAMFVPFDDKQLRVEFASFRDRLRPGDKETWRVMVKGPRGEKVEAGAAELLAYMYDQSLDLFVGHAPPSVVGLYPYRAPGVDLRSSQGEAYAQRVSGDGFQPPPRWEPPEGDVLRFGEGYGLGGVGLAGGVVGGVVGGVLGGSIGGAPPPPPPPPAPAGAPPTLDSGSVDLSKQENRQAGAEPHKRAPAPRTNFAETAFWIPQLLTGPDGSATLEFTVPDSMTAWNVWVHAVTRDLKGGSAQRTVRTVKELMVRPYVPRFLREGDQAVLEVVVNNAGDAVLEGSLALDIVDPETEERLLERFGVKVATQAFSVKPRQGTHVRFPLSTPARVGPVAFRVTASAGDLSDGELRPLPVLPGRMHLTQSRFVTLRNADRKEMTFEDLRREDDPSRLHEQLVVTVDTQLFSSVLQALPYLVDYPYECTEQTLNRFVSSGIVSSLFGRYPAVAKMAQAFSERQTRLETWDATDPNRKMALEETPWLETAKGGRDSGHGLVKVLDPRVAKAERDAALDKLRKAQTGSGGFPWWPGGPPSPYMTLYIVHGLARAAEYGVEVPEEMTRQAWSFLAQHFRDEYGKELKEGKADWAFLTFLNYVASSYPDARFTGEALTAQERSRMLDYSLQHWKAHSPYLKGQLALTLKRAGRDKDAQRVWDSVMDSAKTTDALGTHWAPEDRSWLWYNDTTETHAFALRVLTELRPTDPRREGLVQWLLLDKKVNHWKSTRATAEAIYALVKYLEREGALGIREDARVTVGERTMEFVFEPDTYTGKGNRVVVPGPEVKAGAATVTVEKQSKGFAFASATWHFSTERLPEEERGDFFQVSRRYFRREKEGREVVLQPLAEGAMLKPGDEVEVQLSLRAKHAAEYVHLRDPRAAGLEPEGAVSRHQWDLGLVWYEETRDSGTNFFFEWLPAGEYTFKYRLRANMAGTFRVGPATVQSMYAPEFTAYSTGAVLTVH